ncbi:MAG TPA: hypothetical protein VEX11_06710 [Acetobacteraceae bacterium]|nr:hypothetical protein [Acetobacteraceae bacterium]
MPSQLLGFTYRMTWNDFPHPMPPLRPNELAKDAEFAPRIAFTPWLPQLVRGSNPGLFLFPDNLTVRVFADRSTGRVSARLKTMPQAQKDKLLQHEQGHYNIAALIGRDFFLEALQLREVEYDRPEDAEGDFKALQTDILDQLTVVQEIYDFEVSNGGNPVGQNRWNTMINTAFTMPRSPTATAANGMPLKVRLLDVLRGQGVMLP